MAKVVIWHYGNKEDTSPPTIDVGVGQGGIEGKPSSRGSSF